MWHLVTSSRKLISSFLEYVNFVELAVVHLIGSVKDEKCFATLAFMKSKLCNKLTAHVPIVVSSLHNNSSNFTLRKFSHMLNVLSSEEQHDIAASLRVRV
jgi:hypothetical protein